MIVLAPIITALLKLLGLNVPAWVIRAIAAILPEIIDLVKALEATPMVSNEVKAIKAIKMVADLMDRHLDHLPKWRQLKEFQRDAIIKGIVEITLLIVRTTSAQSE